MRQLLLLIFSVSAMLYMCSSSGKAADHVKHAKPIVTDMDSTTSEIRMKIRIGTNSFTATMENNPSAEIFRSLLPMTIKMTELNGNEKFGDLPRSLPADAANPGTIQSGDIMLYGRSTLVIFYKKFLTSYSYTKLGRIDDVAGLTAALGSGAVTVSYVTE